MLGHIPFEIQVEITKRLPVKLLIQLRSVCKSWKSLIDSSQFIIAYYSAQHTHLLVRYNDSEQKYVSIVDDDTFPQHKVSLTVHPLVKMLRDSIISGSYNGLLCLFGAYNPEAPDDFISRRNTAVLWNPSIRKAIAVDVPIEGDDTILGFGVCRETTDPKIVKITYIKGWSDVESIEVFTLSTGVWRRPYSSNFPRKLIFFQNYSVVLDGFLYWLAISRITMDDAGFRMCSLIISFDLTSEEFREVNLPDSIANECRSKLSISKLKESLVVLEYVDDTYGIGLLHVWIEGGVQKLFTKLYTVNVNTPYSSASYFREFRKTGELVIEIVRRLPYSTSGSLAIYEPNSQSIKNLGINGKSCRLMVYHYMETLLLVDQPDFIIYDKGKSRRLKHKSKSKEPQKTIP